MTETSIESQNGGPNEISLDLLDDVHFGARRIERMGLQCCRTPHDATGAGDQSRQLLQSNLSAWPALSVEKSSVGPCQPGGMAQ